MHCVYCMLFNNTMQDRKKNQTKLNCTLCSRSSNRTCRIDITGQIDHCSMRSKIRDRILAPVCANPIPPILWQTIVGHTKLSWGNPGFVIKIWFVTCSIVQSRTRHEFQQEVQHSATHTYSKTYVQASSCRRVGNIDTETLHAPI